MSAVVVAGGADESSRIEQRKQRCACSAAQPAHTRPAGPSALSAPVHSPCTLTKATEHCGSDGCSTQRKQGAAQRAQDHCARERLNSCGFCRDELIPHPLPLWLQSCTAVVVSGRLIQRVLCGGFCCDASVGTAGRLAPPCCALCAVRFCLFPPPRCALLAGPRAVRPVHCVSAPRLQCGCCVRCAESSHCLRCDVNATPSQ